MLVPKWALLASTLTTLATACVPPDCDRVDLGSCVNACCKLAWRLPSVEPLAFASNTTFDTLWGNLGSLRAYDPASALLYVLVAQGQSEQLSLAAVDATGTVQSHAHLHGDVGSSSEVLMAMAIG